MSLSAKLYSHGRNTYQCGGCSALTSNIIPPTSCGACGRIYSETITDAPMYFVGPVQVPMFMYKCGACGETGRSSEKLKSPPERCRCGIKFSAIIDDTKAPTEGEVH